MVGRQLAGLTLLDKVERAGGTLVARIRRGALVILSPSTGLDGARVMDGLIPREMVGSHNEELIDRGWHATGAGLAREWRTADRAEKLAMLRDADVAISILVRNEYLDREGIGLVYVSRVSSDAGLRAGRMLRCAPGWPGWKRHREYRNLGVASRLAHADRRQASGRVHRAPDRLDLVACRCDAGRHRRRLRDSRATRAISTDRPIRRPGTPGRNDDRSAGRGRSGTVASCFGQPLNEDARDLRMNLSRTRGLPLLPRCSQCSPSAPRVGRTSGILAMRTRHAIAQLLGDRLASPIAKMRIGRAALGRTQ